METYHGTHKRRVKGFSIASRILLPFGIVTLILGLALLGAGIPLTAIYAPKVQPSSSGPEVVGFVFGLLGIIFGGTCIFFCLPSLIVGGILGSLARSERKEDEASGVDYSDFPYGK